MQMAKEAVYNHLLFHKSLVSESDDGERINGYMNMLKEMDGSMELAYNDPVERSLALVFQLVMENRFDPWDIDLIQFTKLYLKHVRKDDNIDFVTAGQIVLMAWSILKLQSERVLVDIKPVEEMVSYFADWDIMDNLYEQPEDVDYTSLVLDSPEPIIEESIRRKAERPFTLIEFLDTFSEVQDDVRARYHLMELREQRVREIESTDFEEKVHREDLNHDIAITWQRICSQDGDSIELSKLVDGSVNDLVTVFTSILFLSREGKVALRQRHFPFGEITIKNLVPTEERIIELPLVDSEAEAETAPLEISPEAAASQKAILEELAVV